MTLITTQMIYDELQSLKNMLHLNLDKKLKEELQEFPLYQAAKILGIGERKLRELAVNKEIDCMVEEKSNAKEGITFRFTAKQIKDYQEKRKFIGKQNFTSADIDKMIESAFI